MTRKLIQIFIVLLSVGAPALARTSGMNLTALGDYSYTTAYGHSAGLDLVAGIPVGPRFDCQPALQLTTAGVHTVALQTRSIFPSGKNIFYLKNRMAFKDIARSGIYDVCLGLSLGWARDHFDLEAGMFGRTMDGFGRDIHTTDAPMCEPFNLIYSIKGMILKADSPWNIWGSFSNVDLFQFERMWQPIVAVGGWYDITERLTIRLETFCKPTGMFHGNAEFYSICARAGVTLKF